MENIKTSSFKDFEDVKKRLFELVDFISSYKKNENNLKQKIDLINQEYFLNDFEEEINKEVYLKTLQSCFLKNDNNYFYNLKTDIEFLLKNSVSLKDLKDLFFTFYDKIIESDLDSFKTSGYAYVNFEEKIKDLIKILFNLSYLPELMDKINEEIENQDQDQEKHNYWLKHLISTAYLKNDEWLNVILSFDGKVFASYYSHHSDKVNEMLHNYANEDDEKFILLFNYIYSIRKELINYLNSEVCLRLNYTFQLMLEKVVNKSDELLKLSNLNHKETKYLNILPKYFEKLIEKLEKNQFKNESEKNNLILDIIDFKQKIHFLLNIDLVKSGKIGKDWGGISFIDILENLMKDTDINQDKDKDKDKDLGYNNVKNNENLLKFKNLLKLLLISYSDKYNNSPFENLLHDAFYYNFFYLMQKLEKRIYFYSNLNHEEKENKKNLFYQILNDFIQEVMNDEYYSEQLMENMLKHKSSLNGLVFLEKNISINNKMLFLKWFYEKNQEILSHFKDKNSFNCYLNEIYDMVKKSNSLNMFDKQNLRNFFNILNGFKFMDLNFYNNLELDKVDELKKHNIIETINAFNSIKQHIYQPNDELEKIKCLLIEKAKQDSQKYIDALIK